MAQSFDLIGSLRSFVPCMKSVFSFFRWPRWCLGVVLGLSGAGGLASSPDWPQWRGPSRDGHTSGPAWPADLKAEHLVSRWRVELGPGYSTPLVVGPRVFVTETVDRKHEVVRALDRATGKELWRAQWEGALSVPFFAKSNGDWIRATPACDGENLFVAGIRDVLVCLEVSTGKVRWRVDFPAEAKAPVPAFGYVSSPLVDGEFVYTQAGAAVVCLDKRTGKLRWRSLADEGGMWGSVFSSPVVATLGGKRQLVVQTRQLLAGLELETGKPMWTQPVEAFRGMNILTPIVQDDLIFTSTYGGKTIAFRVIETAGRFRLEPAWTHKAQGYMSTPVLVKGHIYEHLKSQRITCFELKTGKECWVSDKSFGKYWSLVANADRLLALDERGTLFLLQATPEKFNVIDSRKVADSEAWAHVAVSGEQVLVRDLKGLTLWHWSAAPPVPGAGK